MKGLLPREVLIIRKQRTLLGLTQQMVADELEISLQQYQRYEYGDRDLHKIPMELGLKICCLLRLNPFELVFGEKNLNDRYQNVD